VRFSFQTSTGKLMLLVVITAVELAFFQDVWQILVIPPITIATLAINLGLWFLLVRPRWMDTRVIGMLLGGVAACLGNFLYLLLLLTPFFASGRFQGVGPIGVLLRTAATQWRTSLPDQGGGLAMLLQIVANGALVIECALGDLCNLAIIWAAGSLECRLRRRLQFAGGAAPAGTPPIDDRAATPL